MSIKISPFLLRSGVHPFWPYYIILSTWFVQEQLYEAIIHALSKSKQDEPALERTVRNTPPELTNTCQF